MIDETLNKILAVLNSILDELQKTKTAEIETRTDTVEATDTADVSEGDTGFHLFGQPRHRKP